MPLTVGTAGHIDHGKTWLVRALTGKDTDRLPEERLRGISIDLGYAALDLPDGQRLSLIDVPGHERFVRTMVAGATGIDLFLLVIDAAEGARPQTLEHLAILRLLGVAYGVVAVTKSDAVDAETLALAIDEARELVPRAAIVAVSAKTGAGLDELRDALAATAAQVRRQPVAGATRLYVDRAFTIKGIGTVVTGTLWSGSVEVGDELELQPQARLVRVRTVEVHDVAVERAESGQRVAVSLPGVERADVRRGDALVTPGAYPLSYRLDVALAEVEEIPDGARVIVHHGTAALPARVVRSGERFAQLRLAEPILAARGDHVVLRARTTLGGGRVLDPAPPRTPNLARLELLDRGDAASIVRAIVHEPVTGSELQRRGLLSPHELAAGLVTVEQAGDWYFSAAWLEELRARVRARLAARAEELPLDPGLPLAELLPRTAWAPVVGPLLQVERRGTKAYLPGVTATLGALTEAARQLEEQTEQAAGNAVRVEDPELARYLEAQGRIMRVGDGFAVAADAYERARETIVAECEQAGRITLGRFRDLAGISRRSAQLLLERFDADGVTRRIGDERVLRRAAARH